MPSPDSPAPAEPKSHGLAALSNELREKLRDAVAREGLEAFVRRSGSSERAVLRAMSGLETRRGTIALVVNALGAR